MFQIFVGNIIHTKSFEDFEFFNGFIVVDNAGKIQAVDTDFDKWQNENAHLLENAKVFNLSEHEFIMPGFVDCHIHAPQVPQLGLGLDMPLLDWLNTYTFPLESNYADEKYADQVYEHVINCTINNGTTLASYFGTNHHKSTLILAKRALARGQRALVGKVCSDCNSPEIYVETTAQSVADTISFVEEVQNLNSTLVRPTITPRFALSCTAELLQQLAQIAKKYDLHIQSHISENLEEIKLVSAAFGTSYANVYANAGLLTKKTIMAHAVHLEDAEIRLLSEYGSSIAHCPASNTLLSSGLCDVQRFINSGVKVGLGTDVAGGNSTSIKECLLQAITVSQHLKFIKTQKIKGCAERLLPDQSDNNSYNPLDYKQAIYLATLGGAEALSLGNVCGNFIVGKDFDALIIDTSIGTLNGLTQLLPIDIKVADKQLQLLQKVQRFIYAGDDRNIVKVFVAGKEIKNQI